MSGSAMALVLLAGMAADGVAAGQSLADVARREAERRKGIETPGRLYTNTDLPRVPPPVAGVPGRNPANPPGATPSEAASPQPSGPSSVSDATARVKALEEQWRSRVEVQREALVRAEIVVAALESRINALTSESVSRDDPAQRTELLEARDAAAAELRRVQEEIAAGRSALEAMLEEARRAGVPPGWVRERPR